MEYINPDELIKNPAFSQIITTQGSGKTIYIGGQNGVDEKGEIIVINDILEQTEHVMENLEIALHSCETDFERLVKLKINIVQEQNAYEAYQIAQRYLGQNQNPPINTVLFVSGLINPAFLIEIDAVAFKPE